MTLTVNTEEINEKQPTTKGVQHGQSNSKSMLRATHETTKEQQKRLETSSVMVIPPRAYRRSGG
jgi:hypothetical protein